VSIIPIRIYPDQILLNSDNGEVFLGDDYLPQLLEDLNDTLDASPGVALAAPQIGYSKKAIIVDVTRDKKKENQIGHGRIVLFNPNIIQADSQKRIREGCLSVPDFTGNVIRYDHIIISGLLPNGNEENIETSGFEAIAFQHEVDHLMGTIFLDRVRSTRRDLFPRKIN